MYYIHSNACMLYLQCDLTCDVICNTQSANWLPQRWRHSPSPYSWLTYSSLDKKVECACVTTIPAHGVTCIYKKAVRVSCIDKNLWFADRGSSFDDHFLWQWNQVFLDSCNHCIVLQFHNAWLFIEIICSAITHQRCEGHKMYEYTGKLITTKRKGIESNKWQSWNNWIRTQLKYIRWKCEIVTVMS